MSKLFTTTASTAIALCLTASLGLATGAAQAAAITSGDGYYDGSTLYAGFFGNGAVTVDDGSDITTSYGIIGLDTSYTGTVTITGSGTSWTSNGSLSFGNGGNGKLNILNGGTVRGTSTTNAVSLGGTVGSNGNAIVNASQWTMAGDFIVGNAGTGTLEISNGSTVSNRNGFIGSTTTGDGELTVTGAGSTWTNNGYMSVAAVGKGTLNILDGGVVTNSGATNIGANGGSNGSVSVSGTDSAWNIDNYLLVGNSGTGTMDITNGGTVTNTRGIIGSFGTGNGTASVSGAGSLWGNSEDLVIGSRSNGRLEIANGGVVKASRVITATNDGVQGTLAFGIGDDGLGNIVSGLLEIDSYLSLNTGSAFFDLVVDDALNLTLNTEFTLITYSQVIGLFSFLDENNAVQSLLDNSYFTTGIYTFLVDYRARSFVVTLDSIFGDTTPMDVPEPGPLGLIAFGLMGVGVMRLRKRR